MIKRKRRLGRGRGRKFDGQMFYECGSFTRKAKANKVANIYRRNPTRYKVRVVKVKSAVLHGDKQQYPYHVFVKA